MDNLAQFGKMLMNLCQTSPDLVGSNSLTVWKSDISEAYCLCPLHPFWQIKQGVRLSDWHRYAKPAGFLGKGKGDHHITQLKPLPGRRVLAGISQNGKLAH